MDENGDGIWGSTVTTSRSKYDDYERFDLLREEGVSWRANKNRRVDKTEDRETHVEMATRRASAAVVLQVAAW